MSESDRYRQQNPDLLARIVQLEGRLSTLERVPGIGNTTIDRGTLRVKDENGVVRVELGLLTDGTYGLNVKETASETGFHQVPYVYTNTVPSTPGTGETCTSSTYGDLATVGPLVTLPVRSTGRILIIATAQIQFHPVATNPQGDGRFDVAFSGANTRTPNETADPLVGVLSDLIVGPTERFIIGTITAQSVFEGLTAGNTTVTMKYRNIDAGITTSEFFRRTLTVVNL